MCPTESRIIRLVAGELPKQEASELRAHISDCGNCRQLMAKHQFVWDTLGQADVTLPARDLTQAILVAASRRPNSASGWRIAAAALLAIGAGVAVGAAMPLHRPTASAQAPDPGAVMSALGFDAMAADDSGLSSLLAPPLDSDTQEQLL